MKFFYVFLVPVKMVILSAEQDQTAIVIVVIPNGLNGVIALWPVEVVSRQGAGGISLNIRQICIAYIIEPNFIYSVSFIAGAVIVHQDQVMAENVSDHLWRPDLATVIAAQLLHAPLL